MAKTPPFEMGRQHALERGPKTQTGMVEIQALNEIEYLDYLRGVKAGLDEIIGNATDSSVRAEKISEEEAYAQSYGLTPEIHTEFIGEDNA